MSGTLCSFAPALVFSRTGHSVGQNRTSGAKWRPAPLQKGFHKGSAANGVRLSTFCSLSPLSSSLPVQNFVGRSLHCRKELAPALPPRARSLVVCQARSNGGGGSNIVGILATSLFVYLLLTGQLSWLVDSLLFLWVLAILLPVLGMSVIRWFVSRKVVQGLCPNCGANIQGLRGGQPQTCFTCGKPFRVDADDTFVRVGTKFSNEGSPFGAGGSPFGAGGFPFGRTPRPGTSSPFGTPGASSFRQQGTPNPSSSRPGASSSSRDDDIIDAEIVE